MYKVQSMGSNALTEETNEQDGIEETGWHG